LVFGTSSIAAVSMHALLLVSAHMLLRHVLLYLDGRLWPRLNRLHPDLYFFIQSTVIDWRFFAAVWIAWLLNRQRERDPRWDEWRILPDFESLVRRTVMQAAWCFGILGALWSRVTTPVLSPIGSWRTLADMEPFDWLLKGSSLSYRAFASRHTIETGFPEKPLLIIGEITMTCLHALESVLVIYLVVTILTKARHRVVMLGAFWGFSFLVQTFLIPRALHYLIEGMMGVPRLSWGLFNRVYSHPPPGWDRWDISRYVDLSRIFRMLVCVCFVPMCDRLWKNAEMPKSSGA
jgi:hypothetical protein